VLVEEKIDIDREFFLSFAIDERCPRPDDHFRRRRRAQDRRSAPLPPEEFRAM